MYILKSSTINNLDKPQQHTAGQGLAKLACATLAQTKPSEVQLFYTTTGQPHAKVKDRTYSISIAHTKNLVAALAATYSKRIGLDVEYPRSFSNKILAAFLNQPEIKILRELFPKNKKLRETLAWSCKEAYLKAAGLGLRQHPLSLNIQIKNKTKSKITGKILDTKKGREAFIQAKFTSKQIIAISYYDTTK